MLNSKILEFYTDLRDEVMEGVKNRDYESTNAAFKNVFLSYLLETGETVLSDCQFVDFKKDADKIRLDGYSFSDYFNSLTLLLLTQCRLIVQAGPGSFFAAGFPAAPGRRLP